MVTEVIFGVVGGLGLFLFGMGLMSEGLKQIAGRRMRKLLESLTKHRVVAILVGALTTCLVQSSSATTVMTVGFVNAGLLTMKQALCVVLGANVGTTFTAWLVSALGIGAFKITSYALPAIGVGFVMHFMSKKYRIKSWGGIILGFGILFVGISFMKDAFEPLKTSQQVQQGLIWLGNNPILAVLAGTAITVLLQSSSASIAMIQVLAFQGAFGADWDLVLRVTIPFILGDNIGTTITAQLAALRTSRNSKRVAMGHTIFNVLGVLYILPLVWLGIFDKIVVAITPWTLSKSTIMLHLAVAHSTFNVFNTLVFIPLIGILESVVRWLIPVKAEEIHQKPVVLEESLLDTPTIALRQVESEILRMARLARKAMFRSINGIIEDDQRKLNSIRKMEDNIDEFQFEITSYLSALSQRQVSDEVSIRLPVFLHTVNDLERIGDHAVNIAELAERKIQYKQKFSQFALDEAASLRAEADQMFSNIINSLDGGNIDSARQALVNEKNINNMQVEFRRNHVQRMTDGLCTAETGLIFIDLVDNVEKSCDHLTNIAQAVIGGLEWDGLEGKISAHT